MPVAPDNHDAHDNAERIRERLPRRLQELRERCGLSKYRLARESGISSDEAALAILHKEEDIGLLIKHKPECLRIGHAGEKALWMDLGAMAG